MTLTTLRLSKSGLRVAYRASGTGEPLVLVHGVGLQSAAWAPQTAALSRAYCVVALDLPGHGGSDPLPSKSRLEDFVAWCHDVLRALNLGAVNLAGHSMGALIAGGCAARHPDMVRRVAVLNGVCCRDDAARAAVLARAADIRAGQVDLNAPLIRWFGEPASNKPERAMVAGWLNTVDVQGYATAYDAFAHGDATYAKQLAEIVCPFLALTGDDDQNSTPEMSQMMTAAVQDGTCVVIKGHGHMANLTAATQVTEHLLDWLSQPVLAKVRQ